DLRPPALYRSRTAVSAANTAANSLDTAYPARTTLESRPSVRTAMDGLGQCAHSYGSEAWELDSFGVRQASVSQAFSGTRAQLASSPKWLGHVGSGGNAMGFSAK